MHSVIDSCPLDSHYHTLIFAPVSLPPPAPLNMLPPSGITTKSGQENDFKPLYIPNPRKKAIVNRLKKAAAKCDEIVLATDEDREGEAISWHLLQVKSIQLKLEPFSAAKSVSPPPNSKQKHSFCRYVQRTTYVTVEMM